MTEKHLEFAAKPPMGWNSWDCFGVSVTEQDVKNNADFMAKHLRQYGWEYLVIDFGWYAPDATVENYKLYGLKQIIDDHGRLIPDVTKFPSSANGAGLSELADYVHERGLKLGIHIMRGMPIQAAHQRHKIKGTDITCDRIAQPEDRCEWFRSTLGINMTVNGAQQYYDSLIGLYCSWGVDFIKADDMNSWNGDGYQEPYHTDEIEALRTAIDKVGRPMVLSLSPGGAQFCNAQHLRRNANMFRISADFWDDWTALKKQFDYCEQWAPYITQGAWPDPDMLPLGRLGIRAEVGVERDTNLSPIEQRTMMTLWSIFKAPLFFGGHLPDSNPETLALIQNDEVVSVNQLGSNPRCLWRKGKVIAWVSDTPAKNGKTCSDRFLAVFNLDDVPRSVDITLSELTYTELDSKQVEFSNGAQVRDLWAREMVGKCQHAIACELPAHGAVLYQVRGL